jgi:hypothetical protein
MRRAMPAAAEPAIMEVCDEERVCAEERRAVTMGVTIWERKEISWTCYAFVLRKSTNGVAAPGQLRPRKKRNEKEQGKNK